MIHHKEASMKTNGLIRSLKVALILSLVATFLGSPTSEVRAGSNGQQLFFYIYSNTPAKISWIQVVGSNQNSTKDSPKIVWSRSFNPPVSSYELNKWWWKNRTSVDWRMSDGRTGGCLFDVPEKQKNDWMAIGVDRQPGSSCWVSGDYGK
jgi:hypothetical protein